MLRRLYGLILGKLHVSGKDVTLMIASFLLAFSIWLLHNLSLSYSATLSVPVIAMSNIPAHAAAATGETVIEARCRTTGFRILRSERAQRTCTVFISPDVMVPSGGDRFVVSASSLANYVDRIFGDDVRLEAFSSDSYSFTFPLENCKTVPVQPVKSIAYQPQYMSAEGLKCKPDSVIVYGEQVYLDNIDRVFTEPLSLDAVKSSKSGSLRLDVPLKLRCSVESVDYSLDVIRYVEIKKTAKLTVKGAPAGKDISVYPSVVDVSFRCVFPLYSDPREGVSFYVDYDEYRKSLNGKCMVRFSALTSSVVDCRIEPELVECLENVVVK